MNGKEIPVTNADGEMRASRVLTAGAVFWVKSPRSLLGGRARLVGLPVVLRLFNGAVVPVGA
jgi:hypothetical protein